MNWHLRCLKTYCCLVKATIFGDMIYVTLSSFMHHNQKCISLKFPYSFEAKQYIKNGHGFSGFSPFENLTQMEINETNYTKVKIIIPNDYFTFYNGSQIDKVYYDFDKGIIGFDDSQNNKEYRLINE